MREKVENVKRLAPHHLAVANIAEEAKDDPNGIIVGFPFRDYANKDDAKRAARAFQIAFSAMRSRERQKALRNAKAFNASINEGEFKGPYDHLGAYLREGPNEDRWEVRLLKTNPDPIVIEYASTGKIVKRFTPEGERWRVLKGRIIDAFFAAQKLKEKFVNPLTDEEVTFMWNYDGAEYRQLWITLTSEEPNGTPQAPQKEVAEAGE